MKTSLPLNRIMAPSALIAAFVLAAVVFFLPRETTLTGIARIGGPFTLISHDNKTVNSTDFRGKHMLVIFGYTFCPDVCPTELQVMSDALDQLGPKADRVQPLFITIDPERDVPDVLADYVGHFHPSLIGLTGTVEQVDTAARAYRVYYARGEDDGDGEYLMDHSSIMYLMAPDGTFVKHFSHGTDSAGLAEGIAAVLDGSAS